MKISRTVLFAATLAVSISVLSCGGRRERIAQMQNQIDTLMLINQQQDVALQDYESYIAQISAIMDSINVQEGILTVEFDENGKKLPKRKILENLSKLEEILSRKRMEINRLDSLLNERNDQVKNLTKMMRVLYTQLDEKNKTINELRQKVSRQEIVITSLREKVSDLNNDITQLNDTLSDVKDRAEKAANSLQDALQEKKQVYYAIGDKHSLVASGLLTKAEIFKPSTIDLNQLDESKFNKVDMFTFTEVQIFSRTKPEIMSMKPATSSYTLEKSSSTKNCYLLKISDPEKFWQTSRFLVIRITEIHN